jgi:hypothetical protein
MFAKIGPFFTENVDLGANYVGGQKIRGKLNSAEAGVDCFCERSHRERFRETRHSLQEHVTTGEQAYEKSLDHVLLADDSFPDLPDYLLNYRCVSGCNGACGHDLLLA